MSCKNSSVPAVPEVISLISGNDNDDEGKKKSAVPAVPEVISLLSSDDESDDENPHSMVAHVATYPTPPPPPHVTGLVQWDPLARVTSAVAATRDHGSYWIDPTDPPQIELDPSTSAAKMVLFTVQGKPSPLRTARHRTYKWTNTYNPSSKLQATFLKAAKDALSSLSFHTVPVFPNQSILARVLFWVRRPDSHFIAHNRAPGRLKPQYQDQMANLPHRSLDADNLAKFVLDALNGLLYADDSQVVSLDSAKAHDNIGSCNGRVEVQVWRVLPKHLHLIVQSRYHLFR
jgi:hypothetical protein